MKRLAILMLVLIVCFACERDKNPVSPRHSVQVVSLQKGNIFQYHVSNIHGGPLLDWFENHMVTGTTRINSRTYVLINNQVKVRATADKLYLFSNGKETIGLDYKVHVGDETTFYNKKVIVDSIKTRDVFDLYQQVYYVSNRNLNPDTLLIGQYTRTFGVLAILKWVDNNDNRFSLSGAQINGIKYGHFIE